MVNGNDKLKNNTTCSSAKSYIASSSGGGGEYDGDAACAHGGVVSRKSGRVDSVPGCTASESSEPYGDSICASGVGNSVRTTTPNLLLLFTDVNLFRGRASSRLLHWRRWQRLRDRRKWR